VSTRIVITGGSGFLGSLLARRLLREPLGLGGAPPAPMDELTLLDLVAPPADVRADGRVRSVTGELDTALDDVTWGSRTAMNLPALTTTPREMARALDRVAGAAVSDHIDWVDDPVVGTIVGSWPARFRTPRAHRLGLRADASFDDIVRDYLADNPGARS
jgi:D-erythronate 2-dehydrogenase